MDRVKIGITISIDKPSESFFSNGIRQNAIIMRDMMTAIDIVEGVYFINFGPQKDLSQSPWKIFQENIIDYETALDTVNVIICATQFMSGEYVDRAVKKGIRMVNQVLGNEYYGFCESILFKEDHNTIMHKQRGYSAVWVTPQHYETNKDILEVLFELPAQLSPYIWSPRFLEEHVDGLKKSGHAETYQNREPQKRISVFEPNINMVKTSVFPMVIAEKFYKKRPELVKKFSIFGSTNVKNKRHFKKFASSLDVYLAGKMFFEDRFPIAWSLLEHTDVVLSHQQDNALNYLYFDAAWLGFPIVHNAHLIKELGWYYPGFFAEDAVEKLEDVIDNFDRDEGFKDQYLLKSRSYISQYLPRHPRNLAAYKYLIEKLF